MPKGPEVAGDRIPEANQEMSYRLFDLPWSDAGRLLARDPRLLLPIGAFSQHGPHLPLGANAVITEAVAAEVSRRCRILMAPTFRYGFVPSRKEVYAGEVGLRRKTLHRALNELLAGWEEHGFQEIILLSAVQHEPHIDALLMAMTTSATTTVVNLFSIDTSDLLTTSPRSEHAGELETSLLLHLMPDLVQMGQATDVPPDPGIYRRYAHGRVATPPPGSRGTLGFPSRASAEKGEAVFIRYVETLSEVLRHEPTTEGECSTGEVKPGNPGPA